MAITPEIEAELMVQYRRTRSPFKAAKTVGISPAEAWSIIDKFKDDHFEQRFDGRGRPELERYVVATRRAMDREWDNNSPAIADARDKFEEGTHIMTTGRDGPWLILYSIPRRGVKDPKPDYFIPENY